MKKLFILALMLILIFGIGCIHAPPVSNETGELPEVDIPIPTSALITETEGNESAPPALPL